LVSVIRLTFNIVVTEKIYIDGFAGLNNFEMELNQINVLIELVYFFNEVLLDYNLHLNFNKRISLNEVIANEFRKIFFSNIKKNKFIIKYDLLELKMVIVQDSDLNVDINGFDPDIFLIYQDKVNSKSLQEKLDWRESVNILSNNLFIPASRSFVSIVKNIKLFFTNPDVPVGLDSLLIRFSVVYQQYRRQLKNDNNRLFSSKNNKYNTYVKHLINSNFEIINDEDYLVYENGRRVALSQASSGEQALVPILVYLKILHQKEKDLIKTNIFLEEPELHIFPKFQNLLLQLLITVYNQSDVGKLFITTHSPYVLTSFNNLIQAGEMEKHLNDKKLKKLNELIPKECRVNPIAFSAYQIMSGKAKKITDHESCLIAENIIDEVSDKDFELFNQLMDIEYGVES